MDESSIKLPEGCDSFVRSAFEFRTRKAALKAAGLRAGEFTAVPAGSYYNPVFRRTVTVWGFVSIRPDRLFTVHRGPYRFSWGLAYSTAEVRVHVDGQKGSLAMDEFNNWTGPVDKDGWPTLKEIQE